MRGAPPDDEEELVMVAVPKDLLLLVKLDMTVASDVLLVILKSISSMIKETKMKNCGPPFFLKGGLNVVHDIIIIFQSVVVVCIFYIRQ